MEIYKDEVYDLLVNRDNVRAPLHCCPLAIIASLEAVLMRWLSCRHLNSPCARTT